MASSTASITCIAAIAARLNPVTEKTSAHASTIAAEVASSATMMVRRFIRSASTPPSGESTMVGMTDAVRMDAKAAADPVSSRTHIDIAKRSMRLPNREMPRPARSRAKLRERRGSDWGARRPESVETAGTDMVRSFLW